jgi:hypothetical protein
MPTRLCLALAFLITKSALAQSWTDPLRESWVRQDTVQAGDVTLVDGHSVCQIVISPSENPAVQQAAVFLANDIQKIATTRPTIVSESNADSPKIHLVTLGSFTLPDWMNLDNLKDQWEAFQIKTHNNEVWLIGSNFRGTAFAAYCLSERLGVDPLYHWTGYVPHRHLPLILKQTDYYKPAPTFRYRGMFHDDEDILPRPFDERGYPSNVGAVPTEWYARYFETALRLGMNMVAPYTRVQRRHEVQKLASDWGLFYTSHHYDILLSNPWGMTRFGLSEARHAGKDWNWLTNRDGLLNYWRGGVDENKDIHCIWPVGLRGTDDYGYKFPKEMSEDDKAQVFKDAIESQIKLVKDALPPGEEPLFHFTLYTEMLDRYRTGKLQVPPNVIIVWTDDNDGAMRALPTNLGQWKHGVYYHLAYLGKQVKQNMHIVPPSRIAEQFKHIVDSGATEYMLVNVSELREFVMEARMIADICQDAKTALAGDNPAQRYVNWWSREYFGDAAAKDAAKAYQHFYSLLDTYDKLSAATDRFHNFLPILSNRFNGRPWKKPPENFRTELTQRETALSQAIQQIEQTSEKMTWDQKQYFFEHVALGLLMDLRPTQACLKLLDAMDASDDSVAWNLCAQARDPLEKFEIEILRAQRPPFDHWYRQTWIRKETSPWNLHRPHEELQLFLATHGQGKLTDLPTDPTRH